VAGERCGVLCTRDASALGSGDALVPLGGGGRRGPSSNATRWRSGRWD